MNISRALAVVVLGCLASTAWSQATRPSTRPTAASSDDMLNQLLAPAKPTASPLKPVPDAPRIDETTRTAVAPKAEAQNLIREGTILVERMGRLARTADGQPEFTFEADGQAMKDPPMLILPNLKLTQMESYLKNSSHDLKFRVTGMVTEYASRNYIMLENFVVLPEETIPTPSK